MFTGTKAFDGAYICSYKHVNKWKFELSIASGMVVAGAEIRIRHDEKRVEWMG